MATRTDSSIAATIAQQTLFDGIKSALLSGGFSAPIDDSTSGTDKYAVYAVTVEAGKTYGTIYVRLRITTGLVIGWQVFSAWNSVSKTGSNGNTEITATAFTSNSPVSLYALNGAPELYGCMVSQGSTHVPLLLFVPTTKPSWWSLDSYNYGFIPTSNTFGTWRTTQVTPYTTNDFTANLNATTLAIANRITNRRDIGYGFVLYNPSNEGFAGRSSDNLASAAASGTTRYDTLQIPGSPTQEFLVLNPAAGGLAVRTA